MGCGLGYAHYSRIHFRRPYFESVQMLRFCAEWWLAGDGAIRPTFFAAPLAIVCFAYSTFASRSQAIAASGRGYHLSIASTALGYWTLMNCTYDMEDNSRVRKK